MFSVVFFIYFKKFSSNSSPNVSTYEKIKATVLFWDFLNRYIPLEFRQQKFLPLFPPSIDILFGIVPVAISSIIWDFFWECHEKFLQVQVFREFLNEFLGIILNPLSSSSSCEFFSRSTSINSSSIPTRVSSAFFLNEFL